MKWKLLSSPDLPGRFRAYEVASVAYEAYCSIADQENQLLITDKFANSNQFVISKIDTKNGIVHNRSYKKGELNCTKPYHRNEDALFVVNGLYFFDSFNQTGLTFDTRQRDFYEDGLVRDGGADVVVTPLGSNRPSLLLDAKGGSSFNNIHVEWNYKNKPILLRVVADRPQIAYNIGKYTYESDMKKGVGRVSALKYFENLGCLITEGMGLVQMDMWADKMLERFQHIIDLN